MSINRGIGKDGLHIYNGILLSHKNDIMLFAARWMDLEVIILSEVSHRKTNILGHHLYVGSKIMIQMNLLTKQRLTDFENKLMVTKEGRVGRDRRDKLGI